MPALLIGLTVLGISYCQFVHERTIKSGPSYKLAPRAAEAPPVDPREVALLERSFDTRVGMIELLISISMLAIGGISYYVLTTGSAYIKQNMTAKVLILLTMCLLVVSIYAGYYAYESLVIMADAAMHRPNNPAVAVPASIQLLTVLAAVAAFGSFMIYTHSS